MYVYKLEVAIEVKIYLLSQREQKLNVGYA